MSVLNDIIIKEILYENIQDICETNYKKYKYARRMIDLETKNWISSEGELFPGYYSPQDLLDKLKS